MNPGRSNTSVRITMIINDYIMDNDTLLENRLIDAMFMNQGAMINVDHVLNNAYLMNSESGAK